MARTKIPDPLNRRHLIEKELDPAQSAAIADAYLAEDRIPEAIAFLRKAGSDERLRELADQAVERGDAFLLKQLTEAGAEEPGSRRWLELAQAAEAAGRERYARMARRHARSSE